MTRTGYLNPHKRQHQTALPYWKMQGTQQLNTDNDTKIEKAKKPSPIFVDRVSNVQKLIDLLEAHALDKYKLKILRNEQVKIHTKSSEIYTTVAKELEIKGTGFFLYY